jgi:hypothetical protein
MATEKASNSKEPSPLALVKGQREVLEMWHMNFFSKNGYIYLDLPTFRYIYLPFFGRTGIASKIGSFCNFGFFCPEALLRELARIASRKG